METVGIVYGIIGAMGGSMITAIGFLWKLDKHIEDRIRKEVFPIMALIERIEKDLETKGVWMVELGKSTNALSIQTSNLFTIISNLKETMQRIDGVIHEATRERDKE